MVCRNDETSLTTPDPLRRHFHSGNYYLICPFVFGNSFVLLLVDFLAMHHSYSTSVSSIAAWSLIIYHTCNYYACSSITCLCTHRVGACECLRISLHHESFSFLHICLCTHIVSLPVSAWTSAYVTSFFSKTEENICQTVCTESRNIGDSVLLPQEPSIPAVTVSPLF